MCSSYKCEPLRATLQGQVRLMSNIMDIIEHVHYSGHTKMAEEVANSDSQDFARAFGDALLRYLEGHGIGQSGAADLLGLHDEDGKPRRSRINNYFHDSKVRRAEANAHLLYLACVKLPGFYFDYAGYRLRAVKLGEKRREQSGEQMAFSFHRQFNLTGKAGRVNVIVKRPPGRIELSVSLGAATRRKITSTVSASSRA